MNMSAAGAPAHHRKRARHSLAALALGAGVLVGVADVAPARPVADWVPQVTRPALARTDWAALAEALPVSMGYERDALTGQNPSTAPHVYVSPRVGPVIDSATQSYIARGRAAQANARIERMDAKDHAGYGGATARIERMDAKDHPGYGSNSDAQDRLLRRPV